MNLRGGFRLQLLQHELSDPDAKLGVVLRQTGPVGEGADADAVAGDERHGRLVEFLVRVKMRRHQDSHRVLHAQLARQTPATILLQSFHAVFTGQGKESDDARHFLALKLRGVAGVHVAEENAENAGVALFDGHLSDGPAQFLLEHGRQDRASRGHDLRMSRQLFPVNLKLDVAQRPVLQQRRQVIGGHLGPVLQPRFQDDVHDETGDFQLELSATVGAQFVDVVLAQHGRPLPAIMRHRLAGDAAPLRLDHIHAFHRIISGQFNNDFFRIAGMSAVGQRARERRFSEAHTIRQISARTAASDLALDEDHVLPQSAHTIHLPRETSTSVNNSVSSKQAFHSSPSSFLFFFLFSFFFFFVVFLLNLCLSFISTFLSTNSRR